MSRHSVTVSQRSQSRKLKKKLIKQPTKLLEVMRRWKKKSRKPEVRVVKFVIEDSIANSANGAIYDEWFYGGM